MPCRTQLHHTELHDFSAKRARIQEAPEAQPPDLYLPFPCGNPGLSVFSQKYLSVGRAFKGKAYKFCVLSADGLLKPTKLCARWFECISHWIGGPSGLELEQPQHLGEVVFLIVRLANIFPGLREAALSILIYLNDGTGTYER